jgi:TetR/AcrR family transcriptional regulator
MGDTRNPERTRQALLDAALAEFSERGRAGARTSSIAARAGVNKQLISHHFGGKDGLYRALVARWLDEEADYDEPDLPLADLAARYAEEGTSHRALHRLLLRASLEEEDGTVGVDADDLERMRQRQRAGELAADLDPAFVLLALEAVVALGIVFPADVRRVTGLDPASKEFAAWQAAQLRILVARLADRQVGGDEK